MGFERGEHSDHAKHGTQQTHQRRNGGNRAQRIQITLEIVGHMPPRFLDTFLDDGTLMAAVDEARRQHATERRPKSQMLDFFIVQLT